MLLRHLLQQGQTIAAPAQLLGAQVTLRTLNFPSPMVIDEIGYLPITRASTMLFFQLTAQR